MKCNPVFLLLNKGAKNENQSIRNWLKETGFLTSEAADVFRAMEEISDFTVKTAPEVVVIEALTPISDFSLIQLMTQNNDDVSVFALSENENLINHKQCFEGNLAEIKAKFSSLQSRTQSKSARAKTAA